MRCGACGFENRADARFCRECGTGLTLTCPSCGTALPPGTKFCDSCGAAVGAPAAAAAPIAVETRKIVTLVFADLAGSTSLQEQMDPESARRTMERFYALMTDAITAHGGRVVKLMGDGVMAAFGVPEVQEDDAVRAVRAAAAMHAAFAKLDVDQVGLRIGVNTGEVVVSEGDDDVVGDAVNVAARLEHAAAEGDVLIGESTWRLVRDLMTFESVAPLDLKGKAEPVPAYRLVATTSQATATAAPFVGRQQELAQLTTAFENAATTRTSQLAVVIGSPGLGKSRLAAELAGRVHDRATVLEARCDAHSTSAYTPVTEVVTALLQGVEDPELIRVGESLLGIGTPATPQETFRAIRRLLEVAAAEQPVLLIIDDIQWAEPLLLDLIDHVVEWATDAPVLVVALARPEIREVRPAMAERNAIVLTGLSDDASAALMGDLPPDLAARFLATAEGNPLYLRELLRMVADDGVENVDVPPTISALLAARIERLHASERSVVERASVVGHEFYRGAVVDLVPAAIGGAIDSHLETLRRKEMVEPEGTYWIDEPVFRFHHALIRDAAYRRLLKEARAELHARFADWLADKVGELVGEHEEVIGYHLEQAHEYRRQLGPLDDDGIALGRRAATHLAAAAARALERDDLSAAIGLTGRALEQLPEDDGETRAALLLDRCEALLAAGEGAAAIDAVAQLRALSTGDARLGAWADAFAAELRILTESKGLVEVSATAAAAAATLDELGDKVGAAKAHAVHARALGRLGQVGEAEAALDRALTAARAAGDRRRANAVLISAPVAALWGPSPVARASGRCLDVVRVLRITSGAPAVEATALRCQAVLEALRGRFDAARRLLDSARLLLQDLGLRHALLETEAFAGLVELLAAEAEQAERMLRAAYDGFGALGASTDAAQAGALLARALLALDRDAEAEALTVECERLGGDDLKSAIAWRSVRAQAMAGRGAIDEALVLANEAVALAEPTDALIDHADARAALAVVLRAAGRAAEADEAAAAAAALSARKEAQPATPGAAPTAAGGVRTIQPEEAEDAVRAMVAWRTALIAEDWEAVGARYTEDFVLRDHRAGLQTEVRGRDVFVAGAHRLYAGTGLDWEVMILAYQAAARVGLGRIRTFNETVDRSYHIVGSLDETLRFVELEQFDDDDAATAFACFDRMAAENCPARFAVDASGVRDVTRWVRASGDAVLYETADALVVAEARDGLVTRSESFALDDNVGAGLRLADWQPSPHVTRWLCDALVSALDRHTWDDGAQLFTADVTVDDRRSGQVLPGVTGPEELFRRSRSSVELAPDVRTTVRDWLLLRAHVGVVRMVSQGHLADGGGAFEVERIAVGFTRGGRMSGVVFFDHDDEAGALALARGDDASDNAATELLTRSRELRRRGDWDAVRGLFAPEFVYETRRAMTLDTVYGIDGLMDNYRVVADLGGDVTSHALATRGRWLALVRLTFVQREDDGVESRIETLQVCAIDPETGLGTRIISFEIDDLDAAYAELDALYAASLASTENAASRLMGGIGDAVTRRDWDAIRAVLTPDFVYSSRRAVSINEDHDAQGLVQNYITSVGMGLGLEPYESLATRGEWLALVSTAMAKPADDARLEIAQVVVVDPASGKASRMVSYELDNLDAAYAELDALYLASLPPDEAATVGLLVQVVAECDRGDWPRVAELLGGVDRMHDRRTMGLGSPISPADWIAATAEIAPMIPDGRIRLIAVPELHGSAFVFETVGAGHDEHGGEVEIGFLVVGRVDKDRVVAFDLFDTADIDGARARFRDLGRVGHADGNLSFRIVRRAIAASQRRDWAGVRAELAPDFVYETRRAMSLIDRYGVDGLITNYEAVYALGGDFELGLIATRGDAHALVHTSVFWRDVEGAESRIDIAQVCVADPRSGRLTRTISFEMDDLDAAYAELDALYVASLADGEAAAARLFVDVIGVCHRQEWLRFRELLAGVGTVVDHRLMGFGTLSVDEWVDATEALADLMASGTQVRLAHVYELSPSAGVFHLKSGGRDQNGILVEFENVTIGSIEDGRVTTLELFDAHDLDGARARFRELTAAADADENVAARRMRELGDLSARRDWSAVKTLVAPHMVYESRRAVSINDAYGIDGLVENFKVTVGMGLEVVLRACIATRGDSIALVDTVLLGGEGVSESRIEMVQVVAVDPGSGLITRMISYDVDADDLDAAYAELDAQYAASLPPAEAPAARHLNDLMDAYNRGDWAEIQTSLGGVDLVEDHRLLGLGSTSVTVFVDALKALSDLLSPDRRIRVTAVRERGPHAWLCEQHTKGTDARGTPVEFRQLVVIRVQDGRVMNLEVFDLEAIDAARVRFRELS